MNNTETIHLSIRNRENILYDADVRALSAVNGSGPFDVLPQHANFISVIEKYVIIHLVGFAIHLMNNDVFLDNRNKICMLREDVEGSSSVQGSKRTNIGIIQDIFAVTDGKVNSLIAQWRSPQLTL